MYNKGIIMRDSSRFKMHFLKTRIENSDEPEKYIRFFNKHLKQKYGWVSRMKKRIFQFIREGVKNE